MPIGGTAFFGQNQSPRITTTYLNQLNRHGDPAPGVPVSTAQASGSIIQPYYGMVGGKLTITNPFATQFSDPVVRLLWGGVYMYVQVDAAATGPLLAGQVVFWLNELTYIVSAVGQSPGAINRKVAGVALNATSPGNWDWIQILGISSVLFGTVTAGAIGQLVTVDPTTTPPAVTSGTTLNANTIGVTVLVAPLTATISPVELNLQSGLNF